MILCSSFLLYFFPKLLMLDEWISLASSVGPMKDSTGFFRYFLVALNL